MRNNFIDRVTEDEALNKIFEKIEAQEGCKIKRICRSANHEGKMYFTAVMVNYTIVEVSLKGHLIPAISEPIIEVEVEAF